MEKLLKQRNIETLNSIDILIVDDNTEMCEELNDVLSEEGYRITGVGTVALAKKQLKKKLYNIVLADLNLPDGTGLELLKETKKINEEIIVIIFTGFASLESSMSALNEGAFGYIQKPLNMNEVKISIKKAIKMQKLSLDNKNLLKRLKELSLKDTHTELYNYRYLIERLTLELKRARRYIFPLSVVMIDIDYFKSVNDVYGHQYGDTILKEFAQYLKNFVRSSDTVARYGGEEFVILLPHTNKKGAITMGKSLLDTIGNHPFDRKGKKLKLKISMGIFTFPQDDIKVDTVSDLLNSVDKALRNAKEMGGNRLSTFKNTDKDIGDIVGKCGKENVNILRKKLSKMTNRVNHTLLESIYAFAKTIEDKEHTSEHAKNMVSIVTEIGRRLNLSIKEIENLRHAVALHDLGKIGISSKILHKRKRLTKKEYETIKRHPQIGAEIIRSVHFMEEVIPIILYHHERFDGLGYPSGLKGKKIHLGAKIIAIIDVYQALISNRPYRKAYSKKEALKIIQKGVGTQFDPKIAEVFLPIMKSAS